MPNDKDKEDRIRVFKFKNYSTNMTTVRTISEIEAMLLQWGVREIQKMYNNMKEVIGISFVAETEKGPIEFRLPVSVDEIQDTLIKLKTEGFLPGLSKGDVRKREVALRVGWRVLKDWLEITFSLMQLHKRSLLESFFQHAVDQGTDKTLFELVSASSDTWDRLLIPKELER